MNLNAMVTVARIEETRLAAARAQLRRGGLDRLGPEGAERWRLGGRERGTRSVRRLRARFAAGDR